MRIHAFVWFFALNRLNQGADPFDHTSGTHVGYIQHHFYEEYHFHALNSHLNAIKLTNRTNKTLQQEVSNADDVPEVRIDLDWDFKFYGHLHSWISISPNGFLTTHPVTCVSRSFCNWRQDSSSNYRRYIAPLMTDLNPSKFAGSEILYHINNTEKSLSVQWHNVTLWQYADYDQMNYTFDFQVKLYSTGSIYFYYFNLPKLPNEIPVPGHNDTNYTLTVGLEDAAYQHLNNGIYAIRPYKPVDVNLSHVTESHVVLFVPATTCVDQRTCDQCKELVNDSSSDFECGWCPELGLCSDGIGREVFEYNSEKFCTDNEMLDDLASETCIDYELNERKCALNDHVLARYPHELTVTGASRFYSGVIVEISRGSNTYVVRYDDRLLLQSKVPYSSVHPCSTVSYDYSSRDLPPHCVPHCAHIDSSDGKSDKIRKAVVAAGIMLAICVVACAAIQLLMYSRRRSRSSGGRQAHEAEVDPFWSMGTGAANRSPQELTRVIVSTLHSSDTDDDNEALGKRQTAAEKGSNSGSPVEPVEMQEMENFGDDARKEDRVQVDVVELGEVELEYSGNTSVVNADANNKGWDMTALGD